VKELHLTMIIDLIAGSEAMVKGFIMKANIDLLLWRSLKY